MKGWLFLTVILFATQAFGQIKGFVGVKGGAQFSSAYIEHTVYNTFLNTGFVPGAHSGIMLKLFTNQAESSFLNAGLQTGLSYSLKGWRQTFNTDEPSYSVKLSYIQLPLEAIAYAGKKNTRYFFTVGIYLERLVSVSKDPAPNMDNIGGAEFYTYEKGRDNEFGYGGRVSVGLQHSFPFGTFHLDGFFTYSISNFLAQDDLSDRSPDLSNLYAAGFTVAYLIPFGKMDF